MAITDHELLQIRATFAERVVGEFAHTIGVSLDQGDAVVELIETLWAWVSGPGES